MKLKAAVVGVGYLGNFHAQKYKKNPGVDLYGVCDVSSTRVQEIANELDTTAYTDYRDLLGKVDLVTIASQTNTHYEVAKFFLENRVHVNVEKPMTVKVSEAKELCALAKRNNLKLQVGHVERFNPALIAAQEKLGKPMFMEVHRLAPFKPRGVDVDVVLDLMIHDLDVILTMVKSEVTNIKAVGVPVLTPNVDIANARLEFANGAVANVTASRVSQSATRKFRVFQGSQYLSIDFGSGEVSLTTKTGEFVDGHLPLEIDTWNLEKGDALQTETDSFIHAVQNDEPVQVPGEDGLAALALAEAIRESLYNK